MSNSSFAKAFPGPG